ncbi:DUF2147 domain-containing protein [Parvularcula sp. ZS-1/3]|uniref:DUF2147 domain-containing protein n=1 Tax=Parvularcula mediterranea TaxID=2732508 RepID=A0A7Y3W5V0_9PROT|nr:DUF2147 domain-containing protein [Parvularcula mediterranea]NNU16656.1 DUF2147 domain-containing protein [Parvularcula mediterranea]
MRCQGTIGILLGLAAPACLAADLDVDGRWYTPDRESIVEIRDCGDGTPCGTVAWVDGDHGGMIADTHNRDHDLRGRPMVGVTLLHGFEREAEGWQAGRIYNPEDGRFYRARIRLLSDNALAVSGCLGPICKKLIWERADQEISTNASSGEVRSEDVASL